MPCSRHIAHLWPRIQAQQLNAFARRPAIVHHLQHSQASVEADWQLPLLLSSFCYMQAAASTALH